MSTATVTAPSAATPQRGLLGDGLALSASAMLTSGAGLIGWLVATRLLSPTEVGTASSFVNSFLLVAAISELGLGPALLRWLPAAGRRTGTLLRRSYLIVSVTAVIVSAVWFAVAGPTIRGSIAPVTAAVLFVLAGLGWTLFQLQDSVLTGIGAARWVPLENVLFSAARLGLLLSLGRSAGSAGLVLSWVVPSLSGVAVVSLVLLLARRVRRVDAAGVLPDRRAILRYVGPTYPATVFTAVLYNVVPLLVTAAHGPVLGAVFFVVWMGLNTLDYAAVGFVNALVVRLAAASSDVLPLIRHAAVRLFAVFAPLLAVAFVAAHWVLGWFGAEYADQGTALLRIIVLAFAARLLVVLLSGVHQAAGRGIAVAVLQAASAIGTAAAALTAHGTTLTWIGWGFLLVQAVIATAGLFDLRRRSRRVPLTHAEST